MPNTELPMYLTEPTTPCVDKAWQLFKALSPRGLPLAHCHRNMPSARTLQQFADATTENGDITYLMFSDGVMWIGRAMTGHSKQTR